jgi:anti-sigma factor RsiW
VDEDWIGEYVTGRLAPTQRDWTERHVAKCCACASLLKAELELIDQLQELLGEPGKRSSGKRNLHVLPGGAASH